MGVTIDSLEIEIQSDSATAARGIDDFIASLETLKKSSKLTTVTKNLNNLSTAIKGFSDASRATTALGTLASAIEKLRNAGSIASQANNFTKLQSSLKALEGVDMDKLGVQIQKLATATAPLSNVKAGGFGTMVNGLSKLKEVTDSLDDDTIAKFTEKIEKLNEKLGPFAEKMANVKDAFKAIGSESRKASEGVEELGSDINASALNLSSIIEIARTAIDTIINLARGFAQMVKEASEWDGVSARFGRGFGENAQEVYTWIQRLNEEMGINIQQFMKYSSIYANMLQGFGVNAEDSAKMALGYTELTYDIWAGYNDIYQTFDEASEAVKSAIAGEVEPIRRAGFTIVESTLEQTAANHGLEISLYNATEAQKSYLRYLTLVDQAHAQNLVGTYAKELNTAEGLMRTFSQQIKSLSQAFTSLFLPILVRVMPYLQAFVELLTEGVYWLANLLGVEIQPVDFSGYEAGAGALDSVKDSATGATGALDDATKAAKALKNATVGIDELNVISPNSGTAGNGAGGAGGGAGSDGFAGLDVDSLWDETIFDTIQSDVDSIKEKMKGWLPVIASVAGAIGGLSLIGLLSDVEKLKGFNLVKGIKAIGKGLGGIKEYFAAAKALAPEVGWLSALFPKLSAGLTGVGTALAGISAPVWIGIAAAIAAVIGVVVFLVKHWDELKQAVKDFFAENIAPKLKKIGEHFDKIKESLGPLWTDVLKPLFDLFKSVDWKTILGGIGTAFEWLGGIIVGVVGGVIAGTFNSFFKAIEGFVRWISGVIEAFAGFFDMIIGVVTGDGEKIKAGFDRLVSSIADIWGGLYDMTIGSIIEFYNGIIDWFTKMWDILVGHSIVPDTIDAIVEWFLSLPGKIFGSIESFVKGIVDKFSNLGKSLSEKFSSAWEAVKTWWSKKTSLSTYTPSIGNISTKLSSAWESAKTWWKDKKSALSTYTPSIGKIWEKLKSAWETAKTWWSKNRSSLSYTPSIGSISSKLSSAWTTAKNWWNKSRSSLSYTPSIGSIKDKIVSAWNTAKKWWSSNASLSAKLNISVPKLTVNWGEVSALGKTFKYPKSFSVKFAAQGGVFDQGSLIWAGERGPEIMANAGGGKTGVMNVQQMSEAMYEAVYSATIAANRASGSNGGGGGVTKLYIDGREVTATVEKHQHERGASILGFSF